MGDGICLGLLSMAICFDFRSTNVAQLRNWNPYFYRFQCHHQLITQLSKHVTSDNVWDFWNFCGLLRISELYITPKKMFCIRYQAIAYKTEKKWSRHICICMNIVCTDCHRCSVTRLNPRSQTIFIACIKIFRWLASTGCPLE